LRWLGHVERMSEERVVKRLYQNTPEENRSVGRPRLRWMDDVRENLWRMAVTNWRIRAHRRDDWKMVVKETKVVQGLQSHGVVVVVVVVVILVVWQATQYDPQTASLNVSYVK